MSIIYGLSPVLEALRAQRRPISTILLASGAQPARINEVVTLAKQHHIKIERRERRVLDEMTNGANNQGIVAVLAHATAAAKSAATYTDAEVILDSLSDLPLVVLLDNIEDPHNLGAILRTCEGAGVEGVFIPEHRAAGLNDTVAKTSAGAVEYVRVARVTNLVPLIAELKERGIWVVGVEGGTATNYTEFDLNVPLALVMGSEGHGIRRLVKENCDALISIPMHGQINSLNVSVATGVVLFEVLRQRQR